jgi:poly[(R)-3-hydroxyalkanoate] polymerase subunit PhaC
VRPLAAGHDDPPLASFADADAMRRAQGRALDAFGFAPVEYRYRVAAAGRRWRLRAYAERETGPVAFIVAAPIKRPYVWDLTPEVSPVRYALARGLRVYLLDWLPPRGPEDNAGLDAYVDAIEEGAASVERDAGDGARPVLLGHSLGGTFTAIFAALEPERVRGLVLLSAPLCFRRGASAFADALRALVPPGLGETDFVSGSFLSNLSAMASPETFLWSRLVDGMLSLADPAASVLHGRIERWALDEVALPGKLVGEVLEWLYREDRFCRDALTLRGRTIGPSSLDVPTLAVVNSSDVVAPRAAVAHFIDRMPGGKARLIACPGELGVGLQHLAALVGRGARARLWPEIVSWIEALPEA